MRMKSKSIAQRREQIAQAPLAVRERDELDLGAGQVAIGGNQPQVLDARFR